MCRRCSHANAKKSNFAKNLLKNVVKVGILKRFSEHEFCWKGHNHRPIQSIIQDIQNAAVLRRLSSTSNRLKFRIFRTWLCWKSHYKALITYNSRYICFKKRRREDSVVRHLSSSTYKSITLTYKNYFFKCVRKFLIDKRET